MSPRLATVTCIKPTHTHTLMRQHKFYAALRHYRIMTFRRMQTRVPVSETTWSLDVIRRNWDRLILVQISCDKVIHSKGRVWYMSWYSLENNSAHMEFFRLYFRASKFNNFTFSYKEPRFVWHLMVNTQTIFWIWKGRLSLDTMFSSHLLCNK